MKDLKMDKECSPLGSKQELIQGFGVIARRKEAIWNTEHL
jgi:hypothetical protein